MNYYTPGMLVLVNKTEWDDTRGYGIIVDRIRIYPEFGERYQCFVAGEKVIIDVERIVPL